MHALRHEKENANRQWEDAIEDPPQQTASMRTRSELMIALQGWVKTSSNTQAKATKLFGIRQPRMSDMVRGKISLFSLEAKGNPPDDWAARAALCSAERWPTLRACSRFPILCEWEYWRSSPV